MKRCENRTGVNREPAKHFWCDGVLLAVQFLGEVFATGRINLFVYCKKCPLPMEPSKEIETVLIQANKYVAFLWPYMLGGIALTIWAAWATHSAPLAYMGLAVFLVAPAVLNGTIRSFFTKKAVLRFFPDRLVIEQINEDTDSLERTDEFPFDEIVNYRTNYAIKNNSFFIGFVLADGRKVKFSFWPPSQPAREDDVADTLKAYIKAYNSRPEGGHTIACQSSAFWGS
jgi:hypothetical protein